MTTLPLSTAISLLLGLALSGPSPALWAEDDPAASTASASDARKQAENSAMAGRTAMRESDADPHRAVDAAIAFSHALTAFDQLHDTDAVCEMQADIFWCKKKMNLDNLQEYVAKKGKVAERDFSAAQAVMSKEVPVSEASTYLERARKYQAANPDNHFQIAIFYSEIVDRFPDTDESRSASKVFTTEQAAYLVQVSKERNQEQAQLKDALNQARTNRFQEPPAISSGKQSPMPQKDALATAGTTVKKAYHDEFAHAKKDGQKRALARKLAVEAEQSKDDAAAYYVMLDESQHLAMDSEDYETLLSDLEHLGATFTGFDQAAAKKAALKRMSSHPMAANILKLIEDPSDKQANLAVGRFYCFNLNRWPDGLKMLSLGADADVHQAAEMELNAPKNAEEQKATGDQWLAVGRKAAGPDKVSYWTRAQHWYLLCLPGMSGMNKNLIQGHLDEIEKILPSVITDYDNITPKQWDKLRGQTLTVEARVDRSDSGMTLAQGQRVRIVANPLDVWKWSIDSEEFECGAHGDAPRHQSGSSGSGSGGSLSSYTWGGGKFRQGEMTLKVGGDGQEQALGIISGPGHLWIQPHNTWGMVGTGAIRVKILAVQDDD